ncbi:P-loop containing nucleoside triphosphate hydrolase protein [Scheffersomyces xylosifermentans]|uniref:P-loop containing nucleoside triphosphate hydrolase protein n=1 Tax=Scheffersomyces xylosifermentans TaxID=1304137 RepID=UPI00315DF066
MSSDIKQEPEDAELLGKLSKSVTKNLGISDEEFTVAKFILSLYDKACSLAVKPSERIEKFQTVIEENGGDEFPKEFVLDCYSIISSARVVVKQEPVEPRVKEEPIDRKSFAGLSIPDKEVRWENVGKRESTPDFKREQSPSLVKQEKLEVGQIYKGFVSNLTSYGAFIRLNDPRSFQSGLCHVSQISYDGRTRINQPSEVLKFNQEVFVKIMSIETPQFQGNRRPREKISLTMRGIDQTTGIDHSEELIRQENEDRQSRFDRDYQDHSKGVKRRLTSPERWEIRQLIASGVASAEDYPELNGDEDPNAAFKSTPEINEEDVVTEIELSKEEPKFLKGQTQNSIVLAPVKIFKNPEGSLNRAAMNGSKFVREFKEEKEREKKEKEKELRISRAKSKDSHDPLNNSRSEAVHDSKTESVISDWKSAQASQNVQYGKRTNLSIKEQRETLPVYAMRSELVNAVKENQFVVIVGETGSGKTTQIVQYLSEEGFNKGPDGSKKIIGCTQPRRVAAESVAKRVSEEVGCNLGEEVGYTIRFEDRTSPATKIKYMTDGMLQREALNDPYMSRYSVIMLDEAHERTIATDVLFALLKKATVKNPDLKIIVTSATLDSDKFSKYFNNCPVIKIPGRTFPVEILYTREPEMDYLAAALDSVMQIHISEPQGDILVFLTGQEEIDTGCEALFERMKVLGDTVPELIILPVYSALPSEMQSRIFEPTPVGSRKVILATNIAETSITIDGIYYVVDPGFVKLNAYDSKLGMDSLIVSPISQAQANQRSGRAGRTGPGKCYRLYTETAYKNEMLPNSIPEIQRQNLSLTILMLKAMGINDLLNFEFMDPPPANTMLTALQDLYTLSALDDDGFLTELGRKMADFPMEPALAKTLITSAEFDCSEEILNIVAMLSVQTVFYRPKDKSNLADQRKARFHSPQGDHLTFLNVYRAWTLNNYSKEWCKDNFIQERSMRRAHEVRKQLMTIMRRYKHPIVSCGSDLVRVRRALCAGYFKNSAKRDVQEGYKTVAEQTPVYLHPSSSLFGKNPEFVLYHTLLLTTKEYMHCVTIIDSKWLAELAPKFFRVADPTKLNDQKRNQKIEPLFDKFAKSQDSWRLSAQNTAKRRALGNR